MQGIAESSSRQRQELFAATAQKMGITPAAAEKDFWIVWVLAQLFSLPKWAKRLRFKGGTSLSKAYGVIERFSEDIDLILDWSGLSAQDPLDSRSKTQQGKLNQAINEEALKLISGPLLADIAKAMLPQCSVSQDSDDPFTLNIEYPAEFAPGYLRPVVRLEIGPLAAMLPMEPRNLQSYAAEHFARVFKQPSIQVPTIRVERSIWEKLTILHAEAHRPESSPLPPRYARHYYDVYRLANSQYADKALADTELLAEVVAFKQKFYPVGWASYTTATPQGLQLLPSERHLSALRRDYAEMAEMIFGEIPDFNQLLSRLGELQTQIHTAFTKEKKPC